MTSATIDIFGQVSSQVTEIIFIDLNVRRKPISGKCSYNGTDPERIQSGK